MATDQSIQVMIVDDHPTVRDGLAHRISSQADMQVCAKAADVTDALRQIPHVGPDVVIVDIALKNSDGMELIKLIKTRYRHIRTLVHSMYGEAVYAERCLHAGAMGYVNKESDPDDVITAIREIHAGRVYLSPAMASIVLNRSVGRSHPQTDPIETLTNRQLEIFRLIGEGQTTSQIAEHLHISVHTVETHRENIKHKLHVATVAELTRRAVLWAAENR